MGIVVTITIAALAFANIREVYNSQKDFVVGLLASLAAVWFTKAFSRTGETQALELIRDERAGPVAEALTPISELAVTLRRCELRVRRCARVVSWSGTSDRTGSASQGRRIQMTGQGGWMSDPGSAT